MNSILLCSENGDEQYGGIYCYEMDAMTKYAPELANSTKIKITKIDETRTDFASILIIFQRGSGYGDCMFELDNIIAASNVAKKGNVKVCMVKRYGSKYHVWSIYPECFAYSVSFDPVFYTFKRCGLEMFKSKEETPNDGFSSIDWRALQDYVLKE